MYALLHVHSGLRYLVLAAAAVAIAYFLWGALSRTPAGRGMRVASAVFSGLLDLQIALGFLLVLFGAYYPRLLGHMVPMVLAAIVAHAAFLWNRGKSHPGWVLPLLGVAIALVLMVAGVMAIGRPLIGGAYL